MNCMNCGNPVTRGAEYCPVCGFHVLSQRKAIYLSKLYYNQGLEKASVRDLSGAIRCLKQSLKFSKLNIQARNLLGLVYFETGEVVAALCEWVISKNIMPNDNLAVGYIERLQANPAKLEVINRTVNKYNLALEYCRQGNEDMAKIQLKKLLNQNPKLIKAYHLLALLQIKEEAYGKARRTLKKALKIDKTNTTTLRFLREVDEQTGTTTDLSGRTRRVRGEQEEEGKEKSRFLRSGNDLVILPPDFRESSAVGFVLNLGLGILIGAAALWFLVVPAKTQEAYDRVNQEVLQSGGVMATQEEKKKTEEELAAQEEAANALAAAQSAAENVENLMLAYSAVNNNDYTAASDYLQSVQVGELSQESRSIYDRVYEAVNAQNDQNAQEGQNDRNSVDPDSDSGYGSDSDSGYDSDSDSGYDSGY